MEVPPALAAMIAPKGYVSLDGVSLTVAARGDASFDVALIPETLARTTLGSRAGRDARESRSRSGGALRRPRGARVSRFRDTIPAGARVFEARLQVQWADVDVAGIMYFAAYSRFAENAEMQFFAELASRTRASLPNMASGCRESASRPSITLLR